MDFIRIITAVLCFLLPAQIQAAPQWNQWNQNYGSGSSATNINCGQPGSCLGVGIGSAIAGIASAIKSGQSNVMIIVLICLVFAFVAFVVAFVVFKFKQQKDETFEAIPTEDPNGLGKSGDLDLITNLKLQDTQIGNVQL